MKKVYFACSIRGGRDDQAYYAKIVGLIKNHAEVVSEMHANKELTARGFEAWTDAKIWRADLDMLESADAVIAEVTTPSLGVGYEIRRAEELGLPILALYRPSSERRLSAMIAGSPGVQVFEYQNVSELQSPIAKFISRPK